MAQIGIITEQGDLGYGFNQLNKKDQQIYNEATNKNAEYEKGIQSINESDKK